MTILRKPSEAEKKKYGKKQPDLKLIIPRAKISNISAIFKLANDLELKGSELGFSKEFAEKIGFSKDGRLNFDVLKLSEKDKARFK